MKTFIRKINEDECRMRFKNRNDQLYDLRATIVRHCAFDRTESSNLKRRREREIR